MTPSESEKVALDESGPLLRFASERTKDLNPALPLAIAEAREAAENRVWTPQMSERFWSAFNALCLLIQPVTMDGLSTGRREIRSFNLFQLRNTKTSLAEQTSRGYLWLLFGLIAIALPLQLYVWIGTIESKKIDDNLSRTQSTMASLTEEYLKLRADTTPDTPGKKTHVWTGDETQRADKIFVDAASLDADLDRLLYEASILQWMSRGAGDLKSLTGQRLDRAKTHWYEVYDRVTERYQRTRMAVVSTQESASLIVGLFLSFILPLLFGALGAIAHVIRQISNEIAASTFSQTSPVRHVMRVTLGAVTGTVIGLFSNLSNELSLPPLALAFLAGYGVEAVFSMFDGIIAKFKQ